MLRKKHTHRLRFHLVWVPKYRRRVLEGDIARRAEELFRQACEVNGWGLHELSVQPDHVHLLLQIPPRISVSKAVNLLKGGSSRVLRQEFPNLEEFLWGKSFWCDGFFAESMVAKPSGFTQADGRDGHPSIHSGSGQGADVAKKSGTLRLRKLSASIKSPVLQGGVYLLSEGVTGGNPGNGTHTTI